ncbi:MAG TPA: hypothetical protein VKE88_00515 [Candidatus Nanoarchaeia archaeon]|nr:hypothetical protein [Candidatus Nanoarchaeia archaeon]
MEIQRASVEFTGLKELEALEQTIVKGIAQEYLPILERKVKNNFDLLVHVKGHNRSPPSDSMKSDKRIKYSVHLKLIYANNNSLNIDKVHDWDLPKAMHVSMVALLNRLNKEFKGDVSKTYNRKSANNSEKRIREREMEVRKDRKKSSVRKQANKKRNKTN